MKETGTRGNWAIVAGIFAAIGAVLAYSIRRYRSGCVEGDCRNGHGTMKYGDGSTYIGQWERGKRSGRGVLYYADGTKYDGQWRAGRRDGEGVMFNPDGSIARRGRWKDDLFLGDE